MKNLQLHLYEEKIISNLNNVSKSVQNPDDLNEIFVCDGLNIKKINIVNGESVTLCEISDEIPSAVESDVIDLYLLSIERTVGVVLRTGEVLLINIDSLSINLCINQEFCESGINDISLSPDQELLVLIAGGFVYITNGFLDVISKQKLLTESFGEREFITVGWGKKETQFHGSEGKEAAKSKPQQTSGNLLVRLNETYAITWRGDGALFAVGFSQNSETIFKVFNREGVLQFTSEKQIGIECKFVWRPSGNLIATTQIYPNKYVVAFFEKNGLKHGDFPLNLKYDDVIIKHLSWSGDSEVLCIWYEECESNVSHILIYTMSNYQWYLKQSHLFPAHSKISNLSWEDNSSSFGNKRLHIFLNGGKYVNFEWAWFIQQSVGKTARDDATVGVINGNKIQLTSFRYSVVPPPMASMIIECARNINLIAFGPSITQNHVVDSNSFCILMDNERIDFYTKNKERIYDFMGNVSLEIDIDEKVKNILWFSSETLLVVTCNYKSTYLYVLSVKYEPSLSITIEKKIDLQEKIVGLNHLKTKVILQTHTGKILTYCLANGISYDNTSFPECCFQFDAIEINDEIMLFGLTYRNRFYINDTKIANNVSSYFIHSDFIMLTTLQHQLLSCPLVKKDLDGLQNVIEVNSDQKLDQNGLFFNRKVERGSKIITVVSNDTRTVLQMPRGNIEVIQPRSLSLKIIGNYLDHQQYKEAFDLMRKQRINLNLIYDHDPAAFVANLESFVSQITNTSWLSLFITELDQQDVTATIYNNAYKEVTRGNSDRQNKVQKVCEMIRCHLQANNEGNKNILPILTTYVKNHTTSDLEKALLEIKKVQDNEKNNKKNLVSANEALKYLLYMVNVDDLYNIALGLDDFDLVLFVANKSQKDPKEYVPYLNNLMNLEKNYRKFTIDKDLKRFESALNHLIACQDKDDELVSFVKQHSLYNSALSHINIDDQRYKMIAEEFGKYLEVRNYFSEAGVMFKRSLNYKKAIECFVEALEWQSALYVADKLNISDKERKSLERKLLNKLKESGAYENALLLLENSDDMNEKITCALEGKLYKSALRICLKNNESNLLEEKVKPAIIEQSEMLLVLIKNNEEQFTSQKNRLLVVRKNKMEKAKMIEGQQYVEDCDLYSDTSSIMGSTTSKTSGRSYRSSKNRRKHERKMVSLKEGSRYEDIGLIRALHSLIVSTFSLRLDVSNINNVLIWLGNDSVASKLQKNLESILNHMSKEFDEIWPSDLSAGIVTPSNNIEDAPTIEPYLRIPPIIPEYKWKIQTL